MMLDLLIRIFKVDRLTIGPRWNYSRLQDPFWRLYANDESGASIVHAGQRMRLQPGRLYVIPRGVAFGCKNTRRIQHFWVHFDVHGLPRRMQGELFSTPIEITHGPIDRLQSLAHSLPWSSTDALLQRARLQAAILDVLVCALEDVPDARLLATFGPDDAAAAIQPALDEIERRLSSRLTNATLAACCHMSEDHFIRTFRDAMGRTPHRFITDQRLAIAAQLLRFTDLSIDQVAEQSGFGNRAYLSRIFAQEMDIPPAQYRKSSRV